MAFAIDSEVRECHVYKDVWSAGIDSKLHALQSLQSRRPVCHYTCTLQYTNVTPLIFFVEIHFRRKAVTRNLFSKRKASSKYPKINSL